MELFFLYLDFHVFQTNPPCVDFSNAFLRRLFETWSHYNIVHWFKRLCLPREYLYATLDTIRPDFLVLPAKLTKKGSQNILVLPQDYHYKEQFMNALEKIDQLHIP